MLYRAGSFQTTSVAATRVAGPLAATRRCKGLLVVWKVCQAYNVRIPIYWLFQMSPQSAVNGVRPSEDAAIRRMLEIC